MKVQISKLKLNDIQQNISSPPSRYILILAGGLVGFLLSILYRNRIQNVRIAYSILEITPLLIIMPLLFLDHRQWIETLRAPWLPWLWLSTLIPILIYIFTVFSRYIGAIQEAERITLNRIFTGSGVCTAGHVYGN